MEVRILVFFSLVKRLHEEGLWVASHPVQLREGASKDVVSVSIELCGGHGIGTATRRGARVLEVSGRPGIQLLREGGRLE